MERVVAQGAGLARQVAGRPVARSFDRLAKRTLDVLLSGAGLAGSMPLWAAVALAVKLEDGGDVFYSQERVGLRGRTFLVFKFR